MVSKCNENPSDYNRRVETVLIMHATEKILPYIHRIRPDML